MSRRAIGWLLLLGSPGLAAGVTLTLFFALRGLSVRLPWRVDLALWAAASVASALGGYLIPAATARKETRFLVGIIGFVFGAGVFVIAMVTADLLSTTF